ncbi:MAG: hypothetical protein FJZ79_03305 [Chlorobi bacterium]|nr:hypothetical protein [Chlorobiota bacterium]
MATIKNYRDGSILESIRKILDLFDAPEPKSGLERQKKLLLRKIGKFEPQLLTLDQAMEYIRNARSIAIGERVCRTLHPGSVFTESVFLDNLAQEMIRQQRARKAGVEDARKSLEKSSRYPLIISKVSGSYLEICASIPSECAYWLAEKNGIHCLNRKP